MARVGPQRPKKSAHARTHTSALMVTGIMEFSLLLLLLSLLLSSYPTCFLTFNLLAPEFCI
jgi:hypothetical protein